MISEEGILFIEPKGASATEPVIDALTQRMTAALRAAETGTGGIAGEPFRSGGGYRGWHTCSCGVRSSNTNHRIPNGMITNSLAVHYLARHRDEVPPEQLESVATLEYGRYGYGLENPTAEEIDPQGYRIDFVRPTPVTTEDVLGEAYRRIPLFLTRKTASGKKMGMAVFEVGSGGSVATYHIFLELQKGLQGRWRIADIFEEGEGGEGLVLRRPEEERWQKLAREFGMLLAVQLMNNDCLERIHLDERGTNYVVSVT